MPIYEFRCEECGAEFERLVAAGTDAVPCPECDSERTRRVLSVPAAPFSLVKTRGETRKQERRNVKLRKSAKASFKRARRRARERRAPGPGGTG